MADETPQASEPRPRAWRAEEPQSASRLSSRNKLMFRVLTVIMALAGALVGLFFYLTPFPVPVFLTIPVTQYDDLHFPVNPQVNEDSTDLENCFPGTPSGFTMQEKSLLVRELSKKAVEKSRALVVHLAAHGLVRQGRVYLLPADADPDEATTWLPLEDILRELVSSPARHKFLILDLMQPIADPRLGMLTNDLAASVETVLEDEKYKNLLVLCACEAGQLSLGAEAMHRTAFGYYLAEGLRGAADGYSSTGKSNGRVTVRELAAFVRKRVDRWAGRVRQSRQTPHLFGPASADFELALVAKGTPPENSDPPTLEYLPELRKAWQLCDGWSHADYRVAPRVYRQLEAFLLRAEERWRGGVPIELVRRDLNMENANGYVKKKLDELQSALSKSREGLPAPAKVHDAAARLLRAELAGLDKLPKPEDRAKAPGQFLQKLEGLGAKDKAPDGAKPLPPEKISSKDLAWTISTEAARVNPLGVAQIEFLNELRSHLRLDPARPSRTEEVLGKLAELVAKKKYTADGAKVMGLALRVACAEDFFLSCDPRAFPWVEAHLKTAGPLVKQGLEDLMKTRPPFVKAEQFLIRAEAEYRQAQEDLERIRDIQETCDRALAFLPNCVPYLLNRPTLDEGLDKRWTEAVRLAGQVFRGLAQPANPKDLNELRAWHDQLKECLDDVRKPFETVSLNKLCERAQRYDADPMTLAEIHALLATPIPEAVMRDRLWKTALEFEQKLHHKVRQLDQADDQAKRVTPDPPEFAAAQRRHWEDQERGRALRRAKLSIALLELGGLDPEAVASLRQTLQKAAKQADSEALAKLAQSLQQRWVKGFSEQTSANLAAQDLISRIIHPFDKDATAGGTDPNPTLRRRREEMLKFTEWFTRR